MKKSKDERVQNFLEDILSVDAEKYEILQKLRKTVFRHHPKVGERMMYGGIMFSLGENDFGGVFPSKKHISFEFSNGCQFDNPEKFLEGTGKFRRHLKIRSLSDIDDKQVESFVVQIA